MRAIRVLTAALLVVGGLTAAAPAAGAVAPPYSAITGNADPRTGSGLPFANTAVTAPTHTTSTVVLTVSDDSLSFQLAAPTGGSGVFAEQTYPLAPAATTTEAGLDLIDQGITCTTLTGSLVVKELVASGSDVSAFAANYSISCDGAPTVSGALRYQSTKDYAAVKQAQSSWDFGNQYVEHAGWARKFTFTNAGSATQHFTSATTGSSVFKISNNGCTAAAGIPAGGTCTVTVVPHAASTSSAALATLRLTPAAAADSSVNTPPQLKVALRVLGSDVPPLYVDAGPERVTVNWSQYLPLPIGEALGADLPRHLGRRARPLAHDQ